MEKYTANVKLEINPELATKLEEAQELLKQLTKTIMDMHGMNMLAPVAVVETEQRPAEGRDAEDDGAVSRAYHNWGEPDRRVKYGHSLEYYRVMEQARNGDDSGLKGFSPTPEDVQATLDELASHRSTPTSTDDRAKDAER